MKEKIIKYSKYFLAIIALTLFATITIVKTSKEDLEEPEIIEEPIETIAQNQEEIIEPKDIKVDIKGEINNPGVYKLKEGDRVSDVIKISGGLTENADTSLINLSKNLKDEMVIIIYNKYEIEKIKQEESSPKTITQYIEKECSCPDTINEACIKPKEEKEEKTSKEQSKNNKISINTGSLEELETLPGIGESKAQAIIKYREENGSFKTLEEITNIKGIGTSIFEKFKDYITL